MKITGRQFDRFSKLIYHSCGISLHDGKLSLLQARLAKRLRSTGIDSVDEYLKLLESDEQELINFLDVISTNHTYFFRENHHFECLCGDHLNIWCAASSSGEEPYLVAIHCLEKGFRPSILATDISTKVLQIGERGIYPIEKAKSLPTHILKRYFQKGHGQWEGHVSVKDDIKRMVTFKRFNLLGDMPHDKTFDVIFCRNVLIYFDRTTREQVINKLYNVLRCNGFLIIGGAESLTNIKHRYKYIRPSIYQKGSQP
ncbi:MAG TPA: protein-glutamate O-methyltransferase CheR [Desulfobacterales bacterium]|nr:protein-glutamate O-methyltransferase CheR [Desulfobacterales bacterium]